MDHQPGGFVDDGEVVVAVANVQVHSLQPEWRFAGAAGAARGLLSFLWSGFPRPAFCFTVPTR
jgi:hypothetical protein